MATVIHGFGPNGELSPGATAALAGLGGGGGTSDHGALTGLGDDDHTQYHNDARGDARYYTKGQVDGLVSGATPVAAGGTLPRALSLAAARLANVDTAPFVIQFVGDSLTWSGSAWTDRFLKKLGIANDLTATVLKSKVSGDVSVPASGIYGVNCAADAASSGTYITNGNAVAMATAAQPALIIHGVGTNDFLGSGLLTNYKANVTAAIAALDAACTVPPVHLLWWFGSNYNETKPYTSDQYIQQLLDIAAANPGRVAVVDLGPYADTLGIHNADPYSLDGGDTIHLSAAGYRTVGELMARVILDAPPVNVLGYSAAAPGTTTTTTTAATTTTTTTAAGTTTTTTTAAGTTTTTTTSAGATTITDSFNRADSTTGLGTTDTGQTWEAASGVAGISSNQMYRVSGTALALVDFGQADMQVSVKLATISDFYRVTARAVDASNNYNIESSGTTVKLFRMQTGTNTSAGGGTVSVAVGDVIGIRTVTNGANVDLYIVKNGTVAIGPVSQSGAQVINGTKAGVGGLGASAFRLDDFSVTAPP